MGSIESAGMPRTPNAPRDLITAVAYGVAKRLECGVFRRYFPGPAICAPSLLTAALFKSLISIPRATEFAPH